MTGHAPAEPPALAAAPSLRLAARLGFRPVLAMTELAAGTAEDYCR